MQIFVFDKVAWDGTPSTVYVASDHHRDADRIAQASDWDASFDLCEVIEEAPAGATVLR